METSTKITKKTQFQAIRDILLANSSDSSLISFIDHELELLDNRSLTASKRAEKKRLEGDALRSTVYNALSSTDPLTIPEITTAIEDPNVTEPMVRARLSQLVKQGLVDKTTKEVPVPGDNSRKLTAYTKAEVTAEA